MADVHVPQMQRRDSLGEVLKGLQVASTVYGLYKDSSQLEALKEERDAKIKAYEAEKDKTVAETEAAKNKASGMIDYTDLAKMQQQGWRESAPDQPGGVKLWMPGEGGTKRDVWMMPDLSARERFAAETTAKEKQTGVDRARDMSEKELNRAYDLRGKYDADKTTAATRERMMAYSGIEAAATSEQPSGASDMSMIFQYMKMLDPGSTVREGEFANAQNTGTVPQRVWNKYNQMVTTGEMLDQKQRQDFMREAKSLLTAQLELQKRVDQRYEQDAKKFGIKDTSMVIDPTYQEADQLFQKGKSGMVLKGQPRSPSLPFEDKAQAAPAQFSDKDIDLYLKGM